MVFVSSTFHIKWGLTLLPRSSDYSVIPFFGYLGIRAICEERVQIPLNQVQSHTKRIQSLQLLISRQIVKWDLTLVSRLSIGQIIPFHRYSGIDAILWNWARISQIMCRNTWKVIQSLHLLDSHQVRPCSSVTTLCGLTYTYFTGTRVFGKFEETGPKYPKSCAGTLEK